MTNPFAWAESVLRKRSHYREVFKTQSGKAVLADLRKFSGFGETPVISSAVRQQIDERATFIKIGRQEMFSRIAHMIHLDDAQLINLKEEAQE